MIGKRKEEKTPATHAQLDVARKVLDPLVLVQRALDKRRGDDALFAVHTSDDRVGEQGSGCGREVALGTGARSGRCMDLVVV